MVKIKGWKDTSKKYSDGSIRTSWKSKITELTIWQYPNNSWNIHLEYLRRTPSFIFTDTNNTKQQAYKKAYSYMRSHPNG